MTKVLATTLVLTLLFAAPSSMAAQNTGDGPKGVTVKDLVDLGYVCKPFGDGMLHCTNPDNSVPDWVCYPNEVCTPGKPRSNPGGTLNRLPPDAGISVKKQ